MLKSKGKIWIKEKVKAQVRLATKANFLKTMKITLHICNC